MPSIAFNDVDYAYTDGSDSHLALEHVNLYIREGEFICLVGHSGCGKSTMLNLIAGLATPTRGQVLVDGKPVEGPGPDRSIVFQNYSLFPWLTSLKNVMFALQRTGKKLPRAEAQARARELLAQVGVEDAADRYPSQLSGGMRQRVAIARALAVDAPIMLLDEPFGALDPVIRRRLQELLLGLWEGSCCKTAVFVTHDIDEALTLADRIVFMEPKHVLRTFDLAGHRTGSAPQDEADAYLGSVKREVLELFEATSQGGDDE